MRPKTSLVGRDPESGSPPRPGEPADACPFTRPFPPDFAACGGYQPAAFSTLDLRHNPTEPVLTCANLEVGTVRTGAHYGRCSLGGALPPDTSQPRPRLHPLGGSSDASAP